MSRCNNVYLTSLKVIYITVKDWKDNLNVMFFKKVLRWDESGSLWLICYNNDLGYSIYVYNLGYEIMII